MKTHHAQAVEMSSIVHRRSPDPKINYLAFDILTGQQGQIGIMQGWLTLWDQTQSDTTPAMAWMGPAHSGPMLGMATREQVAALNTLPIPRMHEQFLRLMIRHHRGALPMAAFAASRATSTDLADLASKMNSGQASEIELMQSMLVAAGLPREPESTGQRQPPTGSPNAGDPSSPSPHGGHGG